MQYAEITLMGYGDNVLEIAVNVNRSSTLKIMLLCVMSLCAYDICGKAIVIEISFFI